jgi:hypothetical protein
MTTTRQPAPADLAVQKSVREIPSGKNGPARPRSRWLLPEDGITDEIAIDLAATGTRPVALTPGERRAAAARILAAGGTPYRISVRLHMNTQAAHALAAELTARPDTGAAA